MVVLFQSRSGGLHGAQAGTKSVLRTSAIVVCALLWGVHQQGGFFEEIRTKLRSQVEVVDENESIEYSFFTNETGRTIPRAPADHDQSSFPLVSTRIPVSIATSALETEESSRSTTIAPNTPKSSLLPNLHSLLLLSLLYVVGGLIPTNFTAKESSSLREPTNTIHESTNNLLFANAASDDSSEKPSKKSKKKKSKKDTGNGATTTEEKPENCRSELRFTPSSPPMWRASLSYCTLHAEHTCCEQPHVSRIFSKANEHGIGLLKNGICKALTSQVLCSPCDGDVGTGLLATENTVSLCPTFCNAWYGACKGKDSFQRVAEVEVSFEEQVVFY